MLAEIIAIPVFAMVRFFLLPVVVLVLLLSACLDSNTSASDTSDTASNNSGGGSTTVNTPDQCSSSPSGQSFTAVSYSSALQYLNGLRAAAGMTAFSANSLLDLAAQSHAAYLNANNSSGHSENSGLPGFSGATPNARAQASGYSANISENVSTHSQGTFQQSLDGLFSAIYHRFGFLTVDRDEIGIGYNQDNSNNVAAFVYNMGNSALDALCSGSSFSGTGSYVYNVCADETFIIGEQNYNSALEGIAQSNPAIIQWPAANMADVPPVFFEEQPDPLPEYSVSGYPVSVEFNAYRFSSAPRVSAFSIRKMDNCNSAPLSLIPMSDGKYYMDQNNDPQNEHSAYQFTIFPEKRLDWATAYQVTLAYNDGTDKTLSWVFKTRDLGHKMFTVTSDGEISGVSSGEVFNLYIPPANQTDSAASYSATASSTMTLEISFVDANTLQIKASGSGTASIVFHNVTTSFSL